ncbi:Lcl C-terminal domain-containing protein [Vibrio taketomensis]|uniref:Lcl C-terminal domain-containing protein n=1 Tax=Vibrio taketomensis TaxID=2572923 RepID=UPI001389FE31|nr:DUF1566 domain-containing protein [Vibrio taketomensis]
MQISKIVAMIITSLTLGACGDAERVSFTAIDGYLSNAEVYLDTNQNGVAEADELAGTTDANGQIELAVSALNSAVIIRIVAGQTVDRDYSGTALRSYEMIADAGNTVVTPFTTLLHFDSAMLSPLYADADLQLTEDLLTSDYVAKADQGDEIAIVAHILGRSVALTLQESLAGNYGSDATANNNTAIHLQRHLTKLIEIVKDQIALAGDVKKISDLVVVVKLDNQGKVIQQIITSTSDNNVFRKYAINDTGITQCDTGDGSKVDCYDESGELTPNVLPGQDGLVGRDSNSKLNSNADGSAGFSFSKISASGEVLPVEATQWDCVQDNITGLMWEVKTPPGQGGLRDAAHIYTWYNDDENVNGGGAGVEGAGDCENGNCDTSQYVVAVNQVALCGHTDWRMPTLVELNSLVDFGRIEPAIDVAFFPNTKKDDYWSSNTFLDLSYPHIAFVVSFDDGSGWGLNKLSGRAAVRLVRAGQ